MSEVNRALAALPSAILNEAARNLRHTQLQEQNDIAIRRLLAHCPRRSARRQQQRCSGMPP
ncbi:hypothetical protein M8494_11035 [Serratia ureilytica]